MKKICITFVLFLIIIPITVFAITSNAHTEYLRIHIRADSNDSRDQSVKYMVKDAVVEFLTPFIASCDTKLKAENMLKDRLSDIENVANRVLFKNGFTYTAKASVKEENFPTRSYGDFTLEQGFYKALIIELGSGKGDNWWCVVYPPLCFTGGGTGVIYKSKILEIIKKFSEK